MAAGGGDLVSYIGLGSRGPLAASADTTGLNQGKFTALFAAAELSCNVPFYEVYSMSVTGLAVVATLIVYVSGKVRTTAKLLGNSEWDPQQPILMTPEDQLAFAWDFGTGTKPSSTIWLRYDPALNRELI